MEDQPMTETPSGQWVPAKPLKIMPIMDWGDVAVLIAWIFALPLAMVETALLSGSEGNRAKNILRGGHEDGF